MLSSNKPFLSSKIPKSGISGHHELSKVSSVNARNFNFKTLPGNLPIHCYCRYQGSKRSGLSPFVCPDFQPKPSYDITVNIRFIFDNLSFNFINKLELYNYIRYWFFYRKQPPYDMARSAALVASTIARLVTVSVDGKLDMSVTDSYIIFSLSVNNVTGAKSIAITTM